MAVSHSWRENICEAFSKSIIYANVYESCAKICELNELMRTVGLDSSGKRVICPINALRIHVPAEHSDCHQYLRNDEVKMLCWYYMMLPLRLLHFYVSSCPASQDLMQKILVGAKDTVEELILSYDVSQYEVNALLRSHSALICTIAGVHEFRVRVRNENYVNSGKSSCA